MAFDLRGWSASMDATLCEDKMSDGVELCPFLRNIGISNSISKLKFPVPAAPARAGRGPIFEDGPGFESSFRLFHGKDGVVPLKRASEGSGPVTEISDKTNPNLSFHPLSAKAATISLSSFGPAGPFGFDGFMEHFNAKKPNKKKPKKKEQRSNFEAHMHEAMGSEWLATGQCPIAKSFRAVSGMLPLVSKMLKLPKGMKYRCPPAIVAARAALAKTSAVKTLRPQALPTKVLAIGMLGMALNVPLGVWREHTKKFSPQWFLAVHATIPFIAMLRKAVVMPKYAIAFTIGSAVLGQAVGARAERLRLANLESNMTMEPSLSTVEASVPASKLHSEGSPVMSPIDLHTEALATTLEHADVDTLGGPVDGSARVEKVAKQDEHTSLPSRILAVSSLDSLSERNRSALIRPKQEESSSDSCVDVVSPMAVQKRLTGLPSPLQCGSEALISCSMSSPSQPALVS